MKKVNILRLVLLMVVVLLTALVAPAHVASWDDKITGGGQAINFSITVSAWTTEEGDAGQMEYSRSNLSMHAKVERVEIYYCNGNVAAVVAGPVDAQYDPDGYIPSNGDWMVVQILEGGVGSGDRVRVQVIWEEDVDAKFETPECIFPGLILDGNFNIRSK